MRKMRAKSERDKTQLATIFDAEGAPEVPQRKTGGVTEAVDDRKYLTEEELERFLKVIDNVRDKAIFTVMYWRGLRASEPGRIPLSALRLAAGRLYVTRRKNSDAGEYPLSPAEVRALKAWIKLRGAKPGPLFPSREGRGIGPRMLEVLMLKYATRAGLPHSLRHPHALKHSIGTHLIGKGTELFAVKDWLGHKDIKSTMEYVRFRSKQRDAVAEKVYGEGEGILNP